MMRKPEIDQHGVAARAIQDVGRLEVQMHDVLPMKIVEREGECRSHAGDLVRRDGCADDRVVQPGALDEFHHQIGDGFDIAVRHQRRMMRSLREGTEHHSAHLEGDDVDGAFAGSEARDLDDERQFAVRPDQPVNGRHGSGVEDLAQAKAVDLASRAESAHHPPRSRRRASLSGRPAARIFAAAELKSYGTRKKVSVARSRSANA